MNKKLIGLLICFLISTYRIGAIEQNYETEIKNIKEYNKAGIYEVTKYNKTVTVVALRKSLVRNDEITISASDFILKDRDLNALSEAELIRFANVKAYNVKTKKRELVKVHKTKNNCVIECNKEKSKMIFVSDTAAVTVDGYDPKTADISIQLDRPQNESFIVQPPRTVQSEPSAPKRTVQLKKNIKYVDKEVDDWVDAETYIKREKNIAKQITHSTVTSISFTIPVLIFFRQYFSSRRRIKEILDMFIN